MRKNRAMPLRKLRILLRKGAIRFQDRLGAFAESCGVLAVGAVFLLIMMWVGVGGPSDWASFLAAFVVAAIAVFVLRKAARQQSILIEVTMSYLLHGGKSYLDHLLGKLIAGSWQREQLKPGDALFDVLEEVAHGQDWEMKRRLAEALPALGEVNPQRALGIASTLRDDWDAKWESDLRRRAVEALFIPAVPGRIPLINRVKSEAVKRFLQLRERDQVYTAMAVAEALHDWGTVQPDTVARLKTDLLDFSRNMYPEDESQAIAELLDLLAGLKAASAFDIAQRLENMSGSPNVFVRIAAARNVVRLYERLPDRALELMLKFADPGQHRHVRRPIARELSTEFVIQMIASPARRSKAEVLLLTLITDPDEIIRVAVFDKAEALRQYDKDLFLRMCDFVIQKQTPQTLVARARRLKEELS